MQNLKLSENKKLQIIIICLFAVIPYLNIFQNGFVIDDKAFVSWVGLRSIADIPDILKGEVPSGHEGVYRPLRGIVYLVYSEVFGVNSFWMHLNSVLINILSSILIYLIGSRILKSHLLGFFAGIIFALHPVHTEAITYISSSMDTIGILFMLLSFFLYLHSNSKFKIQNSKLLYMSSVVSALVAFFAYEMTLTLPILLIFYDFCFRNLTINNLRIKIKVYIPYILALVFYLVIRISTVGISGRAAYPGDSLYTWFLVMIKVSGEYLKLILFPVNLAHNHILRENLESFIYRGYNFEKFKQLSVINLDILSYIIIYIAILIICWKTFKKYPIISFCLGAFFILLIPASGIIAQGSVMNERLIYGASFPIILLFVWVLREFLINKKILLITYFLISVIFSVITIQRNLDWRSEITLWTKEISIAPEANAYAYFQLGNALRNNGDYTEAVKNYQKSYQINSNFSVAFASLAQTYDLAGYKDQALNLYSELLKKDPYFWESYRERGKIFMQQKKFDEAKTEFETLLMIYPSNQEAQQFLLIIESMRLENEKRK